jgi:hypothetical protein
LGLPGAIMLMMLWRISLSASPGMRMSPEGVKEGRGRPPRGPALPPVGAADSMWIGELCEEVAVVLRRVK